MRIRLLLAVGLLWPGAATPAQRAQPTCAVTASAASLASRVEAAPLATFDSAWSTIERTHWDTTFNGVSWEQVRAELRPVAAEARTTGALRQVLQEMIGRLRQSHFAIIPQELASGDAAPVASGEPGEPGFDVRLVGDAVLVSAVVHGSPAAAQGIRRGWRLMRVGTCAVRDLQARIAARGEESPRQRVLAVYQAVEQVLAGNAGDTLALEFLDHREQPVQRRVPRMALAGTVTKFGNLPPLAASLSTDRVSQGGRSIGVIRFNIWMPALVRDFDAAIDRLRDADGIVLDLRGNFGGVGGMAMGVAGHFLDTAVSLGTMQQRRSTVRFVANPRRVDARAQPVRPFAGPLAIVVDGLSVSTSEIFAKGLQTLGRARVFGEQTAGQALPAIPDRLPNGDILYHAVAEFLSPAGVPVEGEGVLPDVPIPLTRRALLAGRDEPLEAALRWAASQSSAVKR